MLEIAPPICAAVPLRGHVVRVLFEDGEVRDVDVSDLLDRPAFAALRDEDVFRQVLVDRELGTIAWSNGADIDPDVIYNAISMGPGRARITRVASADPVAA